MSALRSGIVCKGGVVISRFVQLFDGGCAWKKMLSLTRKWPCVAFLIVFSRYLALRSDGLLIG